MGGYQTGVLRSDRTGHRNPEPSCRRCALTDRGKPRALMITDLAVPIAVSGEWLLGGRQRAFADLPTRRGFAAFEVRTGVGLETALDVLVRLEPWARLSQAAMGSARSGRGIGWMARSSLLPILRLATSRSYCACRFSHSCADVPKYSERRNAISAVTARRRRTISLTDGAVTPSAFASLYH
jgi:hypothetical protein